MYCKLSKLESVYKCLDSITTFLQPALPFINSHSVDYFTKGLWQTNLPSKLRQDLERIPVTVELLQSHIDSFVSGNWGNEVPENPDSILFTDCTLNQLVYRVGQHLLPNMNMSIPVSELPVPGFKGEMDNQCVLSVGLTESELKFDTFMSLKKMHEVEIMADFISKISRVLGSDPGSHSSQVKNFVDLGSGKGYLSTFLTMLYDYNVLAIDASFVNTKGSSQRAAKMQRVWSSLIRRAIERRHSASGKCSKRGKHWKSIRKSSKTEDQAEPLIGDTKHVEASLEAKDRMAEQSEMNERLQTQTLYVTQNIDLEKLLSQSFPNSIVEEAETPFGLIGLHTCGSLGTDSLRLFVANENSKFICNVPCCYHLLEETMFQPISSHNDFLYYIPKTPASAVPGVDTDETDFWKGEADALGSNPTFPVSDYLQRKQFNLGRNARMLSSYSLRRTSQDLKESPDLDRSLLWRLLFQVVLQEKQGHTLLDCHVGKLGSRCSTFQEYVRKALVKVHLGHLQISDSEIEDVYRRHEPLFPQYHCFFLLRTLFAPLVEGCILLDRLAYLLEQDVVEQAYIVQLFDPFLSPRCNAILAMK